MNSAVMSLAKVLLNCQAPVRERERACWKLVESVRRRYLEREQATIPGLEPDPAFDAHVATSEELKFLIEACRTLLSQDEPEQEHMICCALSLLGASRQVSALKVIAAFIGRMSNFNTQVVSSGVTSLNEYVFIADEPGILSALRTKELMASLLALSRDKREIVSQSASVVLRSIVALSKPKPNSARSQRNAKSRRKRR